MDIFEKQVYVNDILYTSFDETMCEEGGKTYMSLAIILGVLGINKRNVSFNTDYRILTFGKNGNEVVARKESTSFNGLVVSEGYVEYVSRILLPAKIIIELFGGTYSENENEINVALPL